MTNANEKYEQKVGSVLGLLANLSDVIGNQWCQNADSCTWGHVSQLTYIETRLKHLSRYVSAGVVEGVEYGEQNEIAKLNNRKDVLVTEIYGLKRRSLQKLTISELSAFVELVKSKGVEDES